MSTEIVALIVGVLSFAGTLVGTYMSNNKTAALMGYRIEQLEKKVDKHNGVVERMFKAESDIQTAFVRIDELRHDIDVK